MRHASWPSPFAMLLDALLPLGWDLPGCFVRMVGDVASMDALTWPINMGCATRLPWAIVPGVQVAQPNHHIIEACMSRMRISARSIYNVTRYFETPGVEVACMPC